MDSLRPATVAQVHGLGRRPERGLFYLVALNVLWLGMLVGICAAKHRRKLDVTLLTATGFVVCAAYSFVDRRYGMPADLVVGLRFFVPLLPVLTLGYVALLHQCWGQRIRSAGVPAAAAVLLVAANAAVVATHQEFLVDAAHRRDVASDVARNSGAVVAHVSAAELFNPAWGGPPVVVLDSVGEPQTGVGCPCLHTRGCRWRCPGSIGRRACGCSLRRHAGGWPGRDSLAVHPPVRQQDAAKQHPHACQHRREYLDARESHLPAHSQSTESLSPGGSSIGLSRRAARERIIQ